MNVLSRLGVRLAAVTLVVGILGGVAGGWLVRASTRDAVKVEAERLTVGLAERLADDVDGQVDGLATSFRALAAQQEVSSLSAGAGLELTVALRVYANVTEFALYRADGHAIAAAAKDRLVDPRQLATGEAVAVGEQRTDLVSGNPTELDISVSVESPPGSVVGILRGRVRLDTIVQVLEARLLGDSAKAIFVGADGVILDHPERNRVREGEVYPISEFVRYRARAFQQNGTRVLAALAPTTSLPGSVIIEWDESEALAPVDRQATLVGLLVALTVLATVAIVLVLTTQLLRPLDGLRRVLRQLGQGERDARVDEVGSVEFRQVAQEVNAMASAVSAHITELEHARTDLATAQAQFRAAFEQAPVAMALASPAGTFIDVNPALGSLLGRTRDALLATSVRELTHPDHRAATEVAIRSALRSESSSFELEQAYLHANGQAIPTLTKVACVRSADGDLEYLIVHVVDLSDLREAEERFRRIVSSSPDVFVVVDDFGIIEVASGRVTEMLGYAEDDLVGQPVEVLIPESLRSAHQAHRSAYQNDSVREMSRSLDLLARRSDGSEFPAMIALCPIVIGHRPKVLAVVRDVTERRRGEAAAQELSVMRATQRQAIEINDNIVQGLTVARWSFDLGEVDAARRAVERTVETARLLVDRMLSVSGGVEPGALRREQPAGPD